MAHLRSTLPSWQGEISSHCFVPPFFSAQLTGAISAQKAPPTSPWHQIGVMTLLHDYTGVQGAPVARSPGGHRAEASDRGDSAFGLSN